ncbi:hemicentin-1-like [Mercenaria mercenaria]|uniref:hemicentin-1-like n=1 Tax=Mercenaria mercenaria TaxID=6596 RepID=UPI00234FA8C8|nr:hemicentin-1-like [Mercenaria mercenaria]
MIEPSTSPVTVNESTEVEFKCQTSSGLPAASVSWYKDSGTSGDSSDDTEITSSIQSTPSTTNNHIEVTSVLRYSPPRNENGWRIYCTASNILGQTPIVSGRKPLLNVQYPPGPPVITGYSDGGMYRVIENTQGRLLCSVTGGNPAPTLTWNCINSGTLETTSYGTVTKTHVWIAQRNQDRTCTCRSSHYSGEKTVSVHIEVLYPPSTPTFRINSTRVSGTVKVIRNNRLSVSCISSGNPSPSYTWTHPNMVTTNGQKLSVSNVQNNGKYTCDVRNSMNPSVGAVVPGSNTSFIDVLILYPPAIGELKNTSVAEGSPLTVSCPVIVGYPPQTTFEWIRNGAVWKRTQTFTIDTASRNDAMLYTCKVSNSMKQTGEQPVSQPYTKYFHLNVWYGASVTSFFIQGHQGQINVTVDENEGGIQFTCEVDSNPTSTVKIMLNGALLKERLNTKHISLTHSSVACLDGGAYSCEGNNQYGQSSKKSINLFVNCSPRPLHQIRQNITSALYVPVTLSFTALAYPQPGTKGFAWFKENGDTWAPVLSNADLHISSSVSQSNLTILNVSRADYGRYRLTVTNDLGNYVQYLFLEEHIAENGGSSENCERHSAKETENTSLITGISLGVVVAVLAIYAASITILYKRKTKSKDKQLLVKESTQKTYMNIAYKPSVQENQNNDGATEAKGDETTQYTDLAGYSRDDRTTYEVLQDL